MREGVLADDGFVRLRPEGDDAGQQLAGGVEMFGDDLGFVRAAGRGGS